MGILEKCPSVLSLVNGVNIETATCSSSVSPCYRVSIVRLNYSSSGEINTFTYSEPRVIVPPTSIDVLRSKLEGIEARAAEKQAISDKKSATVLIKTFIQALREKKSSSCNSNDDCNSNSNSNSNSNTYGNSNSNSNSSSRSNSQRKANKIDADNNIRGGIISFPVEDESVGTVSLPTSVKKNL